MLFNKSFQCRKYIVICKHFRKSRVQIFVIQHLIHSQPLSTGVFPIQDRFKFLVNKSNVSSISKFTLPVDVKQPKFYAFAKLGFLAHFTESRSLILVLFMWVNLSTHSCPSV